MTSTPFKDYPYYEPADLREVVEIIGQITRTRKDDIALIQNLPEVLVSGRKVGRVPSSSADVVAGDKVNDINWDTSYIYVLVDNAGIGVWRRAALASW